MSDEKRKLAHIERVEWIKEIEGADNIELCGILGWQCVIAKKDGIKVGDLVCYIEVDSVVPDKPQYEFLRDRKFRIRTIKLRGVVSQGLVLPLDQSVYKKFTVGDDYTDVLGIEKYLSPSEQSEIDSEKKRIETEKNRFKKFILQYSWGRKLLLSNRSKGGFPYWVSKTDETRLQNFPKVLSEFTNYPVYVTEKIDYQSVTFTGIMMPKFQWLGKLSPKIYKFIVCSRNFITNDKHGLYWKVAKKYNIEEILKANPTLTIQGEQGDTSVQGNKYGITEPRMWIFNIFDHIKGYYYDYYEMREFCTKWGLELVPLIGVGPLKDFGETIDALVEYSKGKSVVNRKIEREGIVVRSIIGGKKLLSFKVINPNFLLKYNE